MRKIFYYMVLGIMLATLPGCANGEKNLVKEQVMAQTEERMKDLGEEKTEEKEGQARSSEAQNRTTANTASEKPETEASTVTEELKDTTENKEVVQEKSEKDKQEKTTQNKKTTKSDKNKTKKKKTTEKVTTEEKTERQPDKKDIAAQYIGSTLDSLVAAIGGYTGFSKSESCYYEGEYDGIAQFDGFTVYCHSQGQTTWYIDAVE